MFSVIFLQSFVNFLMVVDVSLLYLLYLLHWFSIKIFLILNVYKGVPSIGRCAV